MPIFTASELNQIITDIREIIQDTSINTLIKYRQVSGVSYYSVEDQTIDITNLFTDWSGVSAVKGLFTEDEVGGNIELGDTKFVIMHSSVSGMLTTQDVVIESGVSYNVTDVNHDPLGIVYVIAGRTAR